MAAGCAFSWFLLPRGFSWAIIACTLLSLLYSVPPVRLKAVAGADLLVNMAGYGALTFGAGALATGAITADVPHLGRMVAFLSLSFGFLFGAFYPMTQIYQIPEDMARGDRTLVVRLGARRALRLSLAMVVAAMVAQLSSTTPGRLELQAAGFFGVLFWACLWCVFTGDWLRRLDVYPHKKGMYRALKLWGLTDVATVVVFGFLAG
jgi:1,4-dihydroxy-2-naphthoate octaprenyltransferase